MEVSQLSLAIFCFAAIIEGMIFGIAYDAFYAIVSIGSQPKLLKKLESAELPLIGHVIFTNQNKKRPAQAVLIFIYDLIFMVCAGIAVSVLVYRFNDGEWRFAIVALLLVGYVLYCKLLRRVTLAFVETLEFFVKCIFAYVMYFTVRPLKKVICLICQSIYRGIEKAFDGLLERKIQKHSKSKKSEMLRNAETYGTVRGG